MCTVKLSDNVMRSAGLRDENEATVEVACRLFDAEKITFDDALEMTGLAEEQFVQSLRARNIQIIYYTAEMLDEDLRNLKAMES